MPETRTTTDQSGLTQYNWSQLQNEGWGSIKGAMDQILWPGGAGLQPPQYSGPLTAPQTAAMEQYLGQAKGLGPTDFSGYQGQYAGLNAQMMAGMQDPNAINFSNNYNPTQFNLPQFSMTDTFAGYQGGGPGMQVQAGQVGGTAGDYRTAVDQVHAPDAVQFERVSGLPQVQGPNLQNYQMGQAERVQAPGGIRDFAINPNQLGTVQAGNVDTQSWTAPGTRQQFMDPYTQGVVEQQKAQAQRDYDEQLTNIHSDAAKAGAFGGSRQAVIEAEANRDLQNRMAGIQAQGLEQSYQSGQQQFNQEQQARLQAQLANQQAGLQAGTFNVGQQGNIALANQQAALAAQGLGTNAGLQAALANQQAGLTTGTQNLQALLQTQGLGAQLGMQGQLANQQTALQSALANQNAGLQAGTFNAQQAMQAQQLNQAANLQAGLNATNLGFQGAGLNAQMGMQAQQLNQAAQQNQYNRMLQGLSTQYGGNLQSGLQGQQLGLQTQQLGEQANQFGAGLNLQTQQGQQAARQAAQNANLGYFQQAGANVGQSAGLAQQGFANDVTRTQMLGQAAQTDQQYAQQAADRNLAMWQYQQQYPTNQLMQYAQMMSMMPQQGSVQTWQQGVNRYITPNPSILNQVAGAAGTFAGAMAGGLKKGGLASIDTPRRLRRPQYAAGLTTIRRAPATPAGLGAFQRAA